MTSSQPLPSASVSAEYGSLYTYLNNRFANTVVLTFEQIESLIGFALPDHARSRVEWWAGAVEGSALSRQASSWSQARMRATPNFPAHSVMFERLHP